MDKKIAQLVFDEFGVEVNVKLTRPEPQFGDFATNVALQLAGKLGKQPRAIAEQLANKLRVSSEFTEVVVAGPGFINVTITNESLTSELNKILDQDLGYGKPDNYSGKEVVTEYSDPNPFKVLHAGHLYTTIVGDAISNLIEFAGGKVHRVNFGGDVGLHVAKTMWAIVRQLGGEYPEGLEEIPYGKKLDWISELYVSGNNAYQDDEQAKREIIEINKRVYKLHEQKDHESDLARIYWTCRHWSYDGFSELYKRLEVKEFARYYPESQTTNRGVTAVEEGLVRGIFKKSEGAVVFDGEAIGLHTRVFLNSEGLPTYEAKDLGLALTKWDDYHFDSSYIITGNDIAEYMKVVIAAVTHFEPDAARRTIHRTHGQIRLADGAKMSSRKGNILRADDVLEAAADANEQAQGNRDEAPVLGAVKYAFLKNRIGGDIMYDSQESVSIHGNSGPYLQYAFARAVSIIRKQLSQPGEYNSPNDHYDSAERALLTKLTEYPEVLRLAVNELAPHHVCTYLYELAQEFNRFYEKSRVVGDERESVRIHLVMAYSTILKSGLNLLGIAAPEKM